MSFGFGDVYGDEFWERVHQTNCREREIKRQRAAALPREVRELKRVIAAAALARIESDRGNASSDAAVAAIEELLNALMEHPYDPVIAEREPE